MRFTALCAAAALLSSGGAIAQETAGDEEDEARFETIQVLGQSSTFGATKSELPVAETPRSLSIITDDEFLERGALALSNTLEYTAGVTSTAFGFATRGDFTVIRGLDAPEYQDNLQVLFGFYNNARADIYTLERVEVLRGPASVLYGQAAPGGIVSTLSKVAGPENMENEIVLTAGSFDRFEGAGDFNFDISGDGRLTARIVGLVRDSDTQVDFVEDDAVVIAPSLTYQTARGSITALFNYTDRESDTSAQFLPLAATACGTGDVTISEPNVCANASGNEVPISRYVGDPGFNKYNTEATTFSLFGTYRFNDVLNFEGTARYRDNEAEYDQVWISFLGDGNPRILPDGSAIGRSWSSAPAGSTQFAFDARLRARFDTGIISHEVLGGLNYQDVETEQRSAFLYAVPTTFNIFNPVYDGSEIPSAATFDAVRGLTETQTIATDLYITDQMTIGNLIVNAGVRLSSVESEDLASDQDDEEVPITIGALYKTSIGLNPYVSYSESFRATVGTDVVTGSALKPRQGEQVEVGFKYQPPGSASYLTVAYFDLEEDNLVDFVPGGQTQPGLSIESTGFEVEALVTFGDFAVDFDFRALEANDVAPDGSETTRSSLPETAGSIWASWEPTVGALTGLRVGAGTRFASEVEDNGTAFLAANGFAPTPNRVVTDGYTLFDAFVGYAFGDIDLTLNVRNLADEEFYATCLSRGDCFPGEARTITARAAYRF
ncbi:MAG: TonB-dependent siderophore receptor [Pseudomonadota bacterium]